MNWPAGAAVPVLSIMGDVAPDDEQRVGALVVEHVPGAPVETIGARRLCHGETATVVATVDVSIDQAAQRKVAQAAYGIT